VSIQLLETTMAFDQNALKVGSYWTATSNKTSLISSKTAHHSKNWYEI
jgi:hypothetical protein